MALNSEIVSRSGPPLQHTLDARWTMAYAAGLGEMSPAYIDTVARPDVLAHPLFPVCFEWPAFVSGRHLPDAGLAPGEAARGVHATHDLVLHKPVRAGMRVTTIATVVSVEARKPGAYQVTRLDTVDGDGEAVCSSWYGNILRGVEVAGGDQRTALGPPTLPSPSGDGVDEIEIEIAANAAHVYTESARIWNAIHTDAAVAKAAGLPAILLHGTATLALAVSRVVATALGAAPERVGRIAGRFSGMVWMPSTLRLRILGVENGAAAFEVLNERGEAAIREGLVALRA